MTTYKCQVNGLFAASRTWSTSFHIVSSDTIDNVASKLDGAWNTFWTTATNGYENLCNADVTVVNTRVYSLNSTFRTTGKKTTPRALAGIDGTNSLPPNLSPIVGFLGAAEKHRRLGLHLLKRPLAVLDVKQLGCIKATTINAQKAISKELDPDAQ